MKEQTLPRGGILGWLVDRLTASKDLGTQEPGQFTPGPWRFESEWSRHGQPDGIVRMSDARTLACFGTGRQIGIGLANAHLIAAAPDLFAACQAALHDRMYKDWPEVADLLIAAIKKAEGR